MHYPYQKDEWALPGNLQNRRCSFFCPAPLTVVSITTSPFLSLLLSHTYTSSFIMRVSENENHQRHSSEEGE
jgi:hypothetical protein